MAADAGKGLHAERRGLRDGAMLFDPDLIDLGLVDANGIAAGADAVFDPDHWQSRSREGGRGGRGAVWFVDGEGRSGPIRAVLRHYRRGGLMAKLMGDRYFWRGSEQSRPFHEFRLMQSLCRRGLPVPKPLAARYRRSGLFYRGDILIERVPRATTLAQCLPDAISDAELWPRLGRTLGRFQKAGAFHADLNAHNILLDGSDDRDGGVWLIDFDRGQILRPAAGWQDANLARLLRSLTKLGAAEAKGFDAAWSALISACRHVRGDAA
ncbi:MAG: 3-deoxy-D-manno-octulosonic acid kinase [Rhodanobacteraceae bacterium]|nr:3-deoxy-D-manno-octulosonic acid kinase [Xanthomonadales bacterium]MCP5478251.1 3-deoxy-D-manno-octulosonic acid kinase [Rhodanobacteraceae bacterium]HPF72939.1 3-deoxy-D-manno-octulosonic acid kinase [Xanthomonadaceae bacterium]HRX99964.1 3-deoxy-D-manno-octulosonic acid kinase [Xanthomonadaceae bacterium]